MYHHPKIFVYLTAFRHSKELSEESGYMTKEVICRNALLLITGDKVQIHVQDKNLNRKLIISKHLDSVLINDADGNVVEKENILEFLKTK